jgi:DNA-directed RNA polymerase specialized sigma24 family protein
MVRAWEEVDRAAARRALARLSAEERVCVVLSAVEGMRYGEIARVLGIEADAARRRITCARTRFRTAYEREAVGERDRLS